MRFCIYCASSSHIDKQYFDEAGILANQLVDNDIEVVFGGGSEGLMGHIADIVCEREGRIQGVMPHFMKEVEWAHPKVTNFLFTDTMHQRKSLLIENTDAIIALPGGTGTLEELFEAITLKRLGKYSKPIVILNTKGYFDPLQAMLDTCVSEKFMATNHAKMWTFVDEAKDVLPIIRHTSDWEVEILDYNTLHQS